MSASNAVNVTNTVLTRVLSRISREYWGNGNSGGESFTSSNMNVITCDADIGGTPLSVAVTLNDSVPPPGISLSIVAFSATVIAPELGLISKLLVPLML